MYKPWKLMNTHARDDLVFVGSKYMCLCVHTCVCVWRETGGWKDTYQVITKYG